MFQFTQNKMFIRLIKAFEGNEHIQKDIYSNRNQPVSSHKVNFIVREANENMLFEAILLWP